MFEEICEQVRREMAAGSLRPGDKLPPERELALKLGVSRAAVREALRSLEIAGVVGLHKGAHGGAFILKGDPDIVTRSIRDMFHLGRVSLDNLTEARTLVMQMAIALVCSEFGRRQWRRWRKRRSPDDASTSGKASNASRSARSSTG